jgi:hypothetical protein
MKRIVFSHQILKKEKLTQKDIAVIVKVCEKDIFKRIKGENIPSESSLIKIYTTTIEGARRLVLVLDEVINVGHFLFYRKKDDSIGKNISIKNPEFKKALHQYLKLWDKDMENNKFEIIELSNHT